MADFGFRVWRGIPAPMSEAHLHANLEANFLIRGSMRYFLAGRFVTIHPGRLSVFWGGTPHQMVAHTPDTECIWITVPIAWLMQWKMPVAIRQQFLSGELIEEPVTDETDQALMVRWARDWKRRTDLREVIILEVEARLRRLAADMAKRKSTKPARPSPIGGQLERVTHYVGENYTTLRSVSQIAKTVDLHPNYLMQMFKTGTGMSLWDYVIRLRLSHAQRLLLTTDWKVLDVALESGFGSVSRFHDAFRQFCRQTPHRYRAANGRAIEPG